MSTQQQQPEEPQSQEAPEDPEMRGAESPVDEKEKQGGDIDQQTTPEDELEGETVHIKVFRYDPEVEGKQEPRFDDFHVPFEKGMTVLDAVMYARDTYDSSLTFRHSCRQAVCGSDAFFVNGKQRLGCKTQIADLEQPIRIEPLPHQEVVKDLVVDMDHFYDQMHTVEPYFQDEDTPDPADLEEQRQSPENREKIKMSSRCIWCGACMSSCNIAAGDNDYLGPAAINKAYKFAMDDREGEEIKEHRLRILEQEHGVWRCQTQFSCTEVCPKDIPLTEHIQELKREAVKKNLKFW
ncbi:succinate dehydrogenase/fumarate reductase iron-sulfur subunit [Haloterrigena sp. SYSU A558-1]|uniref:Succinate dehydrogenase/fumarate reductase iron-sulfur subunit n=1 Tax=Haloterrigena gelatinilytica TaxID=2741724 RepID=A0A8J8GJC4_9EURY|nr:succinate dehydrogenase/fumarate reductase iron-sulfur subunit [Haloterrigena gelatinilytica]NUB91073.1 succinate dehydrogenase/fumarate reductase iron-sulfur subunit [Haloterrigena gelatinilytica]NUC73113.1 succinate dehydrogenase/fumarate reductase iron-sulfur subunit [Haloterrigena gelatinilytica]